jgi:TRAP transporter TAXI family solute receptor
MRNKKTLSILLMLLLVLVMVFTGCTGGKAPVSKEPPEDTGEVAENTGEEVENAGDAVDKSDWPKAVTLTAGPVGGPWYPVMVTFAEYLTAEIPEVNWTVIDGSSMGNIRLVEEGVDAQIGLTHFNALVKALNGTLPALAGETFDNVLPGNAVSLSYIQLVAPANSGVENFKEIFDKKFAPGQKTSAQVPVIEDLLSYYNESYETIPKNGGSVEYVNFADMATLIKDGHIDIACFTGDMPHASGMEADVSVPLRLLKIDDDAIDYITEQYPELYVDTAPPGAYSGTTEPTKVLGAVGTLIFNKNLPDSLVYEFTRVIMNHSDDIVAQYTNPTYCCFLNWDDTLQFSSEEKTHPAVWRAVKEGPSK